ncbi:MAG TPA: ABC transporter ATP-binding protein [Solirubrobacterales bacterium]|nr:ABC transporter ATP-binding protein [Solirubrobacterales bacterium]
MLRAEQIHSGYGRTKILAGLSLRVEPGEMVAVLGRNGVGKTTLLRTIVGHQRTSEGRLEFDGREISRLPVHARARLGIAYVPDSRDVFPGLSVLDNLRVAAYAAGRGAKRRTPEEMLAEFPALAEKRDARGGSLSGGQQQILAVARALIASPKMLLLDEPSEGVQPSIVQEIAALIRSANERLGVTVVLVEQNLDFAVRVAPTAHLMNRGSLVRTLPTAELLNDKLLQREYLGV